ncbi:hypothetical protein [Brachybacterium kimchii]|uniref:Uncharacterized protein n=1 Tax=Brachybacterium kimchii TaxID=2942909 RepID=A0ABY4N2L8_9MICO|nr:hypothetical protein [Brachybacterium kimchii]UQN28106.1 hypothetical protein M4486_10620 [Brachybacterium kimchii]
MTSLGADTDQLRDIGVRMRQGMLRLREVRTRIMRDVSAADRHGADAEEFRGRALGEAIPAMQKAQDDLLRRSDDLVRQAPEQTAAREARA